MIKFHQLSCALAIAVAASFSACTTPNEGHKCPSHCSTIQGKVGTRFDERGLVTKSSEKCKGPQKYVLTVHGKTALLDASKGTEDRLAALAGRRMTAHVIGRWEECGKSKCVCVHVTEVHSGVAHRAAKKGEAAEKPAEAHGAAAAAPGEAKPADRPAAEKAPEPKPSDEKPAEKQ